MIYVGTSGWTYSDWLDFYKEKLSGLEKLQFYARHFKSAEINYSFYHFARPATFKKWHDATPEDFKFAVKLNRQFTHLDKFVLSDDSVLKLQKFLQDAATLEKKFAVLLIQTPKSLKYNLPEFEKFLKVLTVNLSQLTHVPRVCFEFRGQTWFNQDVYDLLKKYNAALVIAQSASYPLEKIVTADFLYLRFHGPEKMFDSSYTPKELREWADFIGSQKSIKDSFVFFNNTMRGRGVKNALELADMAK